VFTDNQFDVVSGVLSGDFDVGFVRTDQIERTKDGDGNPIDPDMPSRSSSEKVKSKLQGRDLAAGFWIF
jgi:hypothetical protein